MEVLAKEQRALGIAGWADAPLRTRERDQLRVVTPLAHSPSTAVKEDAAIQELIEGFADLVSKSPVLMLEALFP